VNGRQRAGDNSTNVQAGEVHIHGCDASEVVRISTQVADSRVREVEESLRSLRSGQLLPALEAATERISQLERRIAELLGHRSDDEISHLFAEPATLLSYSEALQSSSMSSDANRSDVLARLVVKRTAEDHHEGTTTSQAISATKILSGLEIDFILLLYQSRRLALCSPAATIQKMYAPAVEAVHGRVAQVGENLVEGLASKGVLLQYPTRSIDLIEDGLSGDFLPLHFWTEDDVKQIAADCGVPYGAIFERFVGGGDAQFTLRGTSDANLLRHITDHRRLPVDTAEKVLVAVKEARSSARKATIENLLPGVSALDRALGKQMPVRLSPAGVAIAEARATSMG